MRANTQKAQRFFRPKSVEPVSDLPVDLDPEISFQNDGKLDMRMSQNGLTAEEIINEYSETSETLRLKQI